MAHASYVHHLVNGFIAVGPAMAEVCALMVRYARANVPLMLVGATGTGKTTVAEQVHALSGRPGSLAAHTTRELDPSLERSQLFGHERGAFTGASGRHVGWLEEAADGTLLLDEFQHLRRSTQMLLLRALGGGAFRRLGAQRDVPLRCRVILGIDEDPDDLVKRGRLIAELRYRLGFCEIRLRRLEERREEIAPFAQRFLEQCPAETGVAEGPGHFAPTVMPVLEAGTYPGNVRELKGIVQAGYLNAEGADELLVEHLPERARVSMRFEPRASRERQRALVAWALWRSKGNVSEAARLIGAHRNTVAALREDSPGHGYVPQPACSARASVAPHRARV